MMLGVWGPFLSLTLVVAILLALLWKVRRLGVPNVGGGGGAWGLSVLARILIGPRQGIALVRIGDRVLAVSFGDGGVRTLVELSDEESARVIQQIDGCKEARSFKEHLDVVLKKLRKGDG